MNIEYVKGMANAVGDALSRGIPTAGELDVVANRGEDKIACTVGESIKSEWLEELERDADFGAVISKIRSGNL